MEIMKIQDLFSEDEIYLTIPVINTDINFLYEITRL